MRKDERLTNVLQVKYDCGIHWDVWQRKTKVDYCLSDQVNATLVSTRVKMAWYFHNVLTKIRAISTPEEHLNLQ